MKSIFLFACFIAFAFIPFSQAQNAPVSGTIMDRLQKLEQDIAMPTTHQESMIMPYPHIVKIPDVCGGEAIIKGSRIAVWHIVNFYYKSGMSIEQILSDWDSLSPAQVFAALAYYHDNREEIERACRKNSYEKYLAEKKEHWGIVFSTQEPVSILFYRLLRMLNHIAREELKNQVRWLNEFKSTTRD